MDSSWFISHVPFHQRTSAGKSLDWLLPLWLKNPTSHTLVALQRPEALGPPSWICPVFTNGHSDQLYSFWLRYLFPRRIGTLKPLVPTCDLFTPSIENLNKIAIEAENPSNMYFTLTVAGSSVASSDSSPPTGPAFQFAFEVFQGLASVSQCFTSPNHHPTIEGIISNKYGWRWCETNPQEGDICQPLFSGAFHVRWSWPLTNPSDPSGGGKFKRQEAGFWKDRPIFLRRIRCSSKAGANITSSRALICNSPWLPSD